MQFRAGAGGETNEVPANAILRACSWVCWPNFEMQLTVATDSKAPKHNHSRQARSSLGEPSPLMRRAVLFVLFTCVRCQCCTTYFVPRRSEGGEKRHCGTWRTWRDRI